MKKNQKSYFVDIYPQHIKDYCFKDEPMTNSKENARFFVVVTVF